MSIDQPDITSCPTRFPVYGPLEINDYGLFLEDSKKRFNIGWKRPLPLAYEEHLKNFEILKLLGSGSFGHVLKVRNKRQEVFYAMKAIKKEKHEKWKGTIHIYNERDILYNVDCPFALYLESFISGATFFYMVMPYIQGGELYIHLKKVGKFDEQRTMFYAAQIVLGMEYLHHLHLIFRDLKLENVLIDHTGYIKIADFGFCKRLEKERTYTFCGTPSYLAPEMILGKGYGKAVDWWAVGVFLFEMASGKFPFYGKHTLEMYYKICEGRYTCPEHFSTDLKDLVFNLMQVDLTKRYGNLKNGVNDIKQHRWFKRIEWMSLLCRKMQPQYIPSCIDSHQNIHYRKSAIQKGVPDKVFDIFNDKRIFI